MMQVTKLKTLIVLLGFMTIAFTSCDKDDDRDCTVSDIVTVVPLDQGGYSLRADDGTTLLPEPQQGGVFTTTRAYVNYTVLADSTPNYDHLVKINYINSILTKGVINLTATNADSIGNNKIQIISMWEGDDYLNVRFLYNAGGLTVHYINLVNNTTIVPPADGKIHLEFRHNANGDYPRYSATGIVAFDLKPYKESGKTSVDLVIKVNTFDGEQDYNILYDYGTTKGAVVKHSLSQSSVDANYK